MKTLTSMPKVGDVVTFIASTNGEFEQDVDYKVLSIDSDGDAEVTDKHGQLTCILHEELPNFVMKDMAFETQGYFKILNVADTAEGGKQVVSVEVDSDGYDTLNRLVEVNQRATAAADIKAEIAKLQRQLKEL